jgi:eukaryotic-like serine/threonine-protein kinase
MAEEDPKDGEARTVFMPSGASTPPSPPPAAPAAPKPPDEEPGAPADTAAEDAWFGGEAADAPPPAEEPRTVFAPAPASWDQGPAAPAPQPFNPGPQGFAPPPGYAPPPPPAWSPQPSPGQTYAPPTTSFPGGGTGGTPGRIGVGTVLNGIYEVRRFIARGGMGEVYEGINVNTDERVAIKVMLSHLAQDPNVQAMFRKEARTLTRLAHPAVVQYRVLAQDPNLNVLYIVTEFVEGRPLESVLGEMRPTPEQLRLFTRRLCEGLKAAHDLGAIHRDMSPDNVLLPDGLLDHAKIIDFGIAKDLDPSNKTIVGDGFAGKLGFVAPEQFGDYGREVGPWTDVYSVALTVMALSAGRPIDMGATLVDAIDKRRMGPDLTVLPESLRPVFAGMLQPDPAKRFRSMAEVIAALDGGLAVLPPAGDPLEALAKAPPLKPRPEKKAAAAKPAGAKSGPPMALIGGGVGAVVLAGVLAAVLWPRGREEPAPTPTGPTAEAPTSPGAAGPVATAAADPERVRQAVQAALPAISCSWLDIQRADRAQGGVELKLVGAARDSAAATRAVLDAARPVSNGPVNVDMSEVAPAPPAACAALDAFQQIRAPTGVDGPKFTSIQSTYEISQGGVGECDAGEARSELRMSVGAPNADFALVGVTPQGKLQQPLGSRAQFNETRERVPTFATDLGGDEYRLGVCNNRENLGTNGLLLLQGRGPFSTGLSDRPEGAAVRDAAWAQSFLQQARAKGWTASMVWFRVADQVPG